jgi:hypothetical protein
VAFVLIGSWFQDRRKLAVALHYFHSTLFGP